MPDSMIAGPTSAPTESPADTAWTWIPAPDSSPAGAAMAVAPDRPARGTPLPAPRALQAKPWFPRLPDVRIPLLGGGEWPTEGARGRATLLDFWASWCAPCREELPALQAVADRLGPRGLDALAVNVGEGAEVSRRMSSALALRLPIGIATGEIDRAFSISKLPTSILADREGRVRARWDGYVPGLDREIERRALDLLGADPEGAARTIAWQHEGPETFRADWVTVLPSPATAMAWLSTPEGPRLAVVAGSETLMIDPAGAVALRGPSPLSSGDLRVADADGDGFGEMIAFRRGGRKVVVVDRALRSVASWESPAAILDLAALRSENPAARPSVALATVDGLVIADLKSGVETRRGVAGEIVSVVAIGTGAALIRARGDALFLGADGAPRSGGQAPSGARRLVAVPDAPAGAGAVPFGRPVAAGRFAAGGAVAVARVGPPGLSIIEPLQGSTVWRADWSGPIAALAAGDVDGDRDDDLAVAWERSLALLRADAGH